jgi:hypothetical protein
MSPERALQTELGTYLSGPVRLSLDAAGIIGVSTEFADPNPDDWCRPITLRGFAEHFLSPLLAASAKVLEASPVLGRITAHFWILGVGGLMRIEDESGMVGPTLPVPFEGEITLPAQPDELDVVAAEASRAFAREAGLETFE